MPFYEFWCECGAVRGAVRSMGKAPKWLRCRECSKRMYRDFRVNVGVFEPFYESGFTGQPILVTSPAHRDALCEQHRVTPDRYDYSKQKERETVSDTISYQEVSDALKKCSDDDLKKVRDRDDVERGDCFGGAMETAEVPTADS